MNHKFYNKSKKDQNRFQIVLALISLVVVSLLIVVVVYVEFYLIGVLIIAIFLSIIAPFFDMPSLKKSGKMQYYSPLFIAEKPKNGLITIHGGTLFDYYFGIDRNMSGKQRTNFIIYQYLIGLLSLIEKHQNHPSMKIRGTSYIINKRTAQKIGFQVIETNVFQKMILSYNYFNILISNSLAKNRLAFPNINNTKSFEAEISQLLKRKDYINKLIESLKNKHI
ncbi:hypothetical protein [Psychroflexus sp. ALD_RP9]|uniref:hypothetical protein n=1 Tax=Psychroflexus sp. ALD_RP9 TaxID=2777186 RepID=UPI001A8C9A7B|nr:hypothetical protein [Psychroflexus sp. ALD_RP9]QSS98257.1 hypothetical protein IMZ30_05935 [Psychroflexus sp. ALD_RP9]